MTCSNSAAKIFAALMVGATIGASLGILYAPAKGSDIRKKFSCKMDEADELTDSLKDKFNTMLEDIKKDVEMVKGKMNKMA